MKPINQYIDHTLLKPTATRADIRQLCKEAIIHQFASVCVHGMYVKEATEVLGESGIPVAAVTGFPLGAMASEAKVKETAIALKDGAREIDMVIALGALKSGEHQYVLQELKKIKALNPDFILKVILETAYLEQEEIVKACQLAVQAQADFVKTSTGFGPGGASPKNVQLMLDTVGSQAQVKASGGIRDLQTVQAYIQLGATRIGTSSGVQIMQQFNA